MMTYEQIKELIHLVSEQRLQGLEIERSGFRLKITGFAAAGAPHTGSPVEALAASAATVVDGGASPRTATSHPPAHPPTVPAAESGAPVAGGHTVTSPIVGTFYTASSPDAEPFVRAGERVRKGQVLCIVEAMKLMNEIESDVDGVVTEVLPKNGQPVEYGEPLFHVRPD